MATGQRLSILKESNLLSVVILPDKERAKFVGLFLWLVAWSICGVLVFVSYFTLKDQQSKLFVIIYLSFWAYFEFNIARTFMWKRSGKEKLWIKNGIVHYQREINGRGKIRQYNASLVSKFEVVPVSKTNFFDSMNQSFWVRGGERVQFSAQGKAIRIGMQLTDEEARRIVNDANNLLSRLESKSVNEGS